MYCQFVKCKTSCVSVSRLLMGKERRKNSYLSEGEKSSPSPLIQFLPAYRCYRSRLYKKFKWCLRKADITSRSKWLEPVPGRTNEETCLITESIQNLSDFVILFRLILNRITKEYSSGRDLFCSVFLLHKETIFFPFSMFPS